MNVKDFTQGNNFMLYNADCVEVARQLKDESVDFTIYSPPFSSLYTYSNDERDMGNAKVMMSSLFTLVISSKKCIAHYAQAV